MRIIVPRPSEEEIDSYLSSLNKAMKEKMLRDAASLIIRARKREKQRQLKEAKDG